MPGRPSAYGARDRARERILGNGRAPNSPIASTVRPLTPQEVVNRRAFYKKEAVCLPLRYPPAHTHLPTHFEV